MRHIAHMILVISVFALASAPAAPDDGTVVKSRAKLGSVLGRDVVTQNEGDGGRIVDVLADSDGRIRAAVVEFGGYLGIGTRKIAIDWSALRFSGATITVAVSREQLRAATEVKASEPPIVVNPMGTPVDQ